MALKITRAADPISVERINLAIYGPPGIGKTSLAFTAAAPLLLDFDRGAHRAVGRKDIVQVERWADVADLTSDDMEGYQTLVVDTAGRALDVLTADIIKRDAKAGRGGVLTLQGYGKLKGEFGAWLKHVNGLGKDVVLIAHMDEQRSGDDIIERLDVQGGSKGEIYKSMDAMGRVVMRDGRRQLLFSPSDAAFGKNPGQLDPLDVPHPDKAPTFLADVVARIKARLNQQTAEQTAATEALEAWRTIIGELKDAGDVNDKLAGVRAAPKAAQALFAAKAASLGLHFDKAGGQYRMPAAA